MDEQLNGAEEAIVCGSGKELADKGEARGGGRGFFESVLQLPVVEPWPEAVNGSDLLERIVSVLNAFGIRKRGRKGVGHNY